MSAELRFLEGKWEFGKFKLQQKIGDDWVDVPIAPRPAEKGEERVWPCSHWKLTILNHPCLQYPDYKNSTSEIWTYKGGALLGKLPDFCEDCGAKRPSNPPAERKKLWEIFRDIKAPNGNYACVSSYEAQQTLSKAALDEVLRVVEEMRSEYPSGLKPYVGKDELKKKLNELL